MFGLTFEKLLLIGIIAVFVLGPERLPTYAAKLAQLVRTVRDMANGAKTRMKDEMGDDFEDVDWKKLDPRQYDPRRIIREALLEDDTPASAGPAVVRPVTRSANRPEAAYLQHKAKSAGGPEAVGSAAGAGAGVAAAGGVAAGAAVGGASTGGTDAAVAAGGSASADDTSTADAPVVITPPLAVYDSEAT